MLVDSHQAQDLVRRGKRVVRQLDDQPPVVGSAGAVGLRYHVLPREYELVNGLLPLPPPLPPHHLPLMSLAPLSLIFVNTLVGEAEIVIVILLIIVIEVILVVREDTGAAGCSVRLLLFLGRERNVEVILPGLEEGGGLGSQHSLSLPHVNVNLVLLAVTVAQQEVSEQQSW